MSDRQCIAQHRDRGFGSLAEIVLGARRHKQLHREIHLRGDVVTAAIEEAQDVPGFSARIPHRCSGIHQWTISEQAEEMYGIKEVGFSDAIGTENTSK